MKKLYSVLLAFALIVSLLPSTAFAESEHAQSIQNSAHTTRTEQLVISSSSESQNNVAEGWAWDKETKILTLNNVKFDVAEETSALYFKTSATIVLIGENIITSSYYSTTDAHYREAAITAGIYNHGHLVFEGDGSLIATGGKTRGDSYGIFSSLIGTSITINGGTIIAKGGTTINNGHHTAGVYVPNLTINGGHFEAEGGITPDSAADSNNYGIRISGNGRLSVNGGSLTASGGSGSITDNNFAVFVNTGGIDLGDDIVIAEPLTGKIDKYGKYEQTSVVDVSGLPAKKVVIQSNNTIIEESPSYASTETDMLKKITFPLHDASSDITIEWDMNWLSNGDAMTRGLDKNIAIAALVLSGAVEGSKEEAESLLGVMGFESVYHANYQNELFTSPAITLAKSKEKVNGKSVLAIVVRGTDPHRFSDIATDILSEVNGFRPSAENLYRKVILKYIDDYFADIPKKDRIIIMTGHSLGGAMAGLLSTKVGDIANQENTFVYTFASPKYDINDENPEQYSNVHNVINLDDTVPKVPNVKWAPTLDVVFYERVGIDRKYDVIHADSKNTFEAVYHTLTGKTYTLARKESGLSGLIINRHTVPAYMSILLSEMPLGEIKSYFVFEDVTEDNYYADAVLWAAENGITTGTSDTSFSPNSHCTRAQVVTFLWRAMGRPVPAGIDNPFEDVKESQYYTDAVLWAIEAGITNGTSYTTFSPDDTCTNAQILTFIWRSLGEQGKTGTGTWYEDALNWATRESLLLDTDAGRSVNELCPRRDVVTFLYRALA